MTGQTQEFDLQDFLPYMLNRAAEQSGLGFQAIYKARYGMLRMEWRVLFHLGRYGPSTAKVICDRAGLHKTKVSRAVSALEQKRFLSRETMASDRRHEALSLTNAGRAAYSDLFKVAQRFDAQLTAAFPAEDVANLRRCLAVLAGTGGAGKP